MSEPKPDSGTPSQEVPSQPIRKSPVLLCIAVAAILVVGAWACFVWINSENGFDFRKFTFQSAESFKLCPVKGTVYFNDELITQGHVEAYPLKKGHGPTRIIGSIKEDGTFELYSEIRGKMELGAPPGNYTMLLMVHHHASGFANPAKLLPKRYYDVEQSPIKFSVVDSPTGNHIEVRESGEINTDTTESREM